MKKPEKWKKWFFSFLLFCRLLPPAGILRYPPPRGCCSRGLQRFEFRMPPKPHFCFLGFRMFCFRGVSLCYNPKMWRLQWCILFNDGSMRFLQRYAENSITSSLHRDSPLDSVRESGGIYLRCLFLYFFLSPAPLHIFPGPVDMFWSFFLAFMAWFVRLVFWLFWFLGLAPSRSR